MKEIERKFLVDNAKWKLVEKPIPSTIVQGFIAKSETVVVRIRISSGQGFLTIKGKTKGISRTEFEYQVPIVEAQQMLDELTDKRIVKKRYEVKYADHLWEVDEFEGPLNGLILAEIELKSETEDFECPPWVTEDVSKDASFYNAVLIDRC